MWTLLVGGLEGFAPLSIIFFLLDTYLIY
jgi:hypothetical protein